MTAALRTSPAPDYAAPHTRPSCPEHRVRDRAERIIAQRFPVMFALWDSVESGTASIAYLARQLRTTDEHIRLLVTIGGWLCDGLEWELTQRA